MIVKQPSAEQASSTVEDAVARVSAAFGARDVEAALACFAADAAVFGDDLGENAQGAEELRLFFDELFEEPYAMTWEPRSTYARSRGEVIWFVADTEAVLTYADGLVERLPFQLSGTLSRRRGRWSFELFNGTQPVTQHRELLVAAS